MDNPSSSRLRRIVWGALIGLAATAVGLAVAEVVTLLSNSFQSPVVDVADRVVDGVPQSLKQLAIDWFGTNDKRALLIGIGSILFLYAVLMGILALGRRVWPALAGVALFGLAGAFASQTTRRAAPFLAVVPSIVGAVAAGATLMVLRHLALGRRSLGVADVEAVGNDAAPQPRPTIAELTPSDRRRFLVSAGLTTLGAVALGSGARAVNQRSSVAAASRRNLTLPPPADPLPVAPTGIEVGVPGMNPFFTPNSKFYRIDTAITVPQVDVNSWTLRIDGMVERPLTLRFEDLVDRDLVESDITLTCVSNEVGGNLMGTARWLGVRLDRLLEEVGVQPDADQVVGRSVDGYTCGFPVEALDGRDALIAIGMNGEPLPVTHGFPARLIVPGLYGYVSATKWLSHIELTRFDQFDQYWVERGWVNDAPIKVQSRIDTPRGLSTVNPGTVAIAGVAWAQTRGISAVEVRVDDGDWQPARLADELNDVTWRQWSFSWNATSGRHSIAVRATEKNGPIQTDERSEPFPSGATGQHSIIVLVR
jgi:DMSO/TMAO reductase YedYZ molybdopterin-dependent catalytic subunit